MTLPEPLRSFWYARETRSYSSRQLPWGVVTTDSRYPLVWDVNKASVLEPVPGLTLERIRVALLPALRGAGAVSEVIEFWDAGSEALRELRSADEPIDTEVVMVFDGGAPVAQRAGLEVREIPAADVGLWHAYRATRIDLTRPADGYSREAVEQLLSIDRDAQSAGDLRLFAAVVDGQVAGFASLTSLEGIGYVDNVVTRPEFRRRGVATAAVERVVGESFASGDALVHLLASEGGAAQRLYERLGFTVAARAYGFVRPLTDQQPRGAERP